jgi:uncharacterized protein YhfF
MNHNLTAATTPDPSDDDFNVIGGEIFASFSPWASWLGDGNPFAPTAIPSLSVGAGGTAPLGDPGSFVPVTSGGVTINLIFDAAALAAPASFRAGIQQAVSILAASISDKITVNIKIDYSGTGGGAAAGPDHGLFESYSSIRADLVNNASTGDATFNALTAGSSIQGQSSVAVWNAQLKLWGLMAANDTTTDDGSATFATDINPNLLVGVALHELTHAMGRVPFGAPSSASPDIFDLFRFTSVCTRLFQGGSTAPASYFSLDGGNTKLADYGRTSDPSDFLNTGVQGPDDPFNEFYTGSTSQQLTAVDLKQLVALGFHLVGSSGPNHAPVLTIPASNISVATGQSLQMSSLFTATDADNDALTYYFYDSSPAADSGHFVLNGTAIAAGTSFGVSAAQLAQLVFVAGAVGSTDELSMQVSDGQAVSSVGQFHINTTVNHAPVLTVPASNISAHAGQSLQMSSLFTATDADNDALTYYFYDSSPAADSGHFVLNGAAIAAGTSFGVSAAQLAQLAFVAGASGTSDDLSMQLSDGRAVSSVGQFHVNVAANHTPVLTVTTGNPSTTAGQSLQVSSWFSATDADNDALTYYFYDSTAAANSGHFSLNGTAIAAGTGFGISAAQLGQLVFVAGAAGSSDDLSMQLSDGHAVSSIGQFHVDVAPNHAPVLTVSDFAIIAGTRFPAAALFTATDADNDPLTYYFQDESPAPNSGHFEINGTAIPAGTSFGISGLSGFAGVFFAAGAGGTTDEVDVQVSDGHAVSSVGVLHLSSITLGNVAPTNEALSSAPGGDPGTLQTLAGGDAGFQFVFPNSASPAVESHANDVAVLHLNQDVAPGAVASASAPAAMVHPDMFGDAIASHDLHPLAHMADYFVV